MIYVVCVRDCRDYAWDDVVNRFSDDEYAKALELLQRLTKAYGQCFTLRDH